MDIFLFETHEIIHAYKQSCEKWLSEDYTFEILKGIFEVFGRFNLLQFDWLVKKKRKKYTVRVKVHKFDCENF